MKPRVFIASSTEHIELARAVQDNLDRDLETRVWDQDVFKLSDFALEAMMDQLKQSDFGVFVMAPADWAVIRGTRHAVPRDNVVLELGLFLGNFGPKQTFVIIPRGTPSLHLPTDLLGLTIGDYDPNRKDKNLTAALGSVCNKIRRLALERAPSILRRRTGLVRFGLFPDFTDDFNSLLAESTKVILYFIHSRRWRENHNDAIHALLSRPESTLTVFLPDLGNQHLIASLVGHFDDGPHVPGFIADAYRYFTDFHREFGGKVRVLLFSEYPTYSFYKFDDTVIAAMYPTTPIRKSVPAFHFKCDGTFGEFLFKDIEHLLSECNEPPIRRLVHIAAKASHFSRPHPLTPARRKGAPKKAL